MMPPSVAMRTYEEHKDFYDKLQMDVAKAEGGGAPRPNRTRRWPRGGEHAADEDRQALQGARDPHLRLPGQPELYDGAHNGAFTGRLLTVWNCGNFDGNYATFHAAHQGRHAGDPDAEPVHDGAGGHFLKQKPFTV